MGRRHEISDADGDRIEGFLPGQPGQQGGVADDNRRFLNAVLYVARTGIPWRDLPDRLGNWNSQGRRFDRWAKDGTWDRVLRELQGQAHAVAELEWTVSVDSTVARAHQHAAGARRSATGGRSESQDPAA